MPDLAIAFTDGSDPLLVGPTALVAPTLVVVPAQPGPAPAAAAPAAPATPQQPPTVGALAKFEGAQVGMTEIKISGACAIEAVGDMVVSLDDLVRAVGVYRVVKVNHYVHPKTGETVRQQVLAPVETLVVVPFDSSNPNDDGIVRARPALP
jgi:hypothetical protein